MRVFLASTVSSSVHHAHLSAWVVKQGEPSAPFGWPERVDNIVSTTLIEEADDLVV
jgi:hypothetical protein